MATLNAIRGMCLEEAVLYLLGTSGYHAVTAAGNDPTLFQGKNGLNVTGRGERHQIDAIGDFCLPPPFSHQQRLLVEAKYHADTHERTGIDVIRNAVGVQKDVSEYWVTAPARSTGLSKVTAPSWLATQRRYHYQYAVVSSTGFTEPAERYAFAQDVALIQVSRSRYFASVLAAIGSLAPQTFDSQSAGNIKVELTNLRATIRNALSSQDADLLHLTQLPSLTREGISSVVRACFAIQIGLLAVTPTGCPILMVANPSRRQRIRELVSAQDTSNNAPLGQIVWDQETGGFTVQVNGQDILSFDIPPHLVEAALDQQGLQASNGQSTDIVIEVLFMDTDNRTNNHDISRQHTATLMPIRLPRAELNKFLNKFRINR